MVAAPSAAHQHSNEDGQSCYGFTIRSGYPLKFLRYGKGKDTLEVLQSSAPLDPADATLLLEWTLRDPNADVTAKLYHGDGVFHFWTSDAGWYRIDPRARRIEMSDHHDEIRREQRLWGIPTALCLKDRGDLVLHAAAVEVDGSAILLAAPGRFGKTTLALAFHRNGYRLLTEDTACCSISSEPVVFPGPTCVRLRPDMFDGDPPDGTIVTAVRDDRIHLALEADRRGDGQPLPLRGVVFLRESAGDVRVERVSGSEVLPDLWTLALRLHTDAERRRSFSQLARVAATVPIWNLYRPLQVAKLDEVVSTLVETCCQ
jgi:hypothetical protein